MKPAILKAPPPVAERPRCPNCDKPLRPWIHSESVRDTEQRTRKAWDTGEPEQYTQVVSRVVSKSWDGTYHAYGALCTMRCAVQFANAAYKAGYRLKRRAS